LSDGGTSLRVAVVRLARSGKSLAFAWRMPASEGRAGEIERQQRVDMRPYWMWFGVPNAVVRVQANSKCEQVSSTMCSVQECAHCLNCRFSRNTRDATPRLTAARPRSPGPLPPRSTWRFATPAHCSSWKGSCSPAQLPGRRDEQAKEPAFGIRIRSRPAGSSSEVPTSGSLLLAPDKVATMIDSYVTAPVRIWRLAQPLDGSRGWNSTIAE
jgi:hypothetical protein